MKNQVIEVLNLDHGKKVIQYWKSRGMNITHEGFRTQDYNDSHRYYGIINGKFDNYSYVVVMNSIVEIITLPEGKTFPREMLVWFDDGREFKLDVIGYCEGQEYPFITKDINHKFTYIGFKYAKEIDAESTVEITIKINGKESKLSDLSEETLLKIRNI